MTHKPNEINIDLRGVLSAFKNWPRLYGIFFKVNKGIFIAVLSLNFLNAIVPLLNIYITQELINMIFLSSKNGVSQIVKYFLLLLGVNVAKIAIHLLQTYFESVFVPIVTNYMRLKIVEKANSLQLSDFEDPNIQDLVRRAQDQIGMRPFQIFKQTLAVNGGIITVVSASIYISLWNWWLALIIFIIPVFSFFSILRISQEEYMFNWRRAPKWRLTNYLGSLLTNEQSFKEVKFLGTGDILIQKYKQILENFMTEDKMFAKKRLNTSIIFEMINYVIVSFFVFLTVRSAYLKDIMVGNLVGNIQSINIISSASQNIIYSIVALCSNNLYLYQIFSFLDYAHLNQNEKNINEHINNLGQIQSIELKNVSYKYPGQPNYAIKNIHLSIESGEKVAIVGRNGSGKTTLSKILTQLYQNYEGEILINGQPINNFSSNEIRRKITIIFQDFVRYQMPLRENIGFGDTGLLNEDEVLFRSLSDVGYKDIDNRFPKGLDTQLGTLFEDGKQLSGGQWQMIALARALIRQADVYLFDEPSSSMDPITEKFILDKISEFTRGKIGICITHRFINMNSFSKIIVMDRGHIVEMGTHEELMRYGGIYRNLYVSQSTEDHKQIELVGL
jgi:ATP-binding cassette, subfamily B, bacterial NisT/SpaT